MAPQSKKEELQAAWRALSSSPAVEGWHTIRVARESPCQFLAGRRSPSNEEALLVGFESSREPPVEQLPQGQGFLVSKVTLEGEKNSSKWVALCRHADGSLDFFTMMADDIVTTLMKLRKGDDEKHIQLFLARIRAWQEFMRRGGEGVLSAEAEAGLYGELEILGALINEGVPAGVAVDAWQGPMAGIHDFSLGRGGIEVKTTVSGGGFPATINSLEQLDSSLIQPLFLAGIRLALDPAGKRLGEKVDEVREMVLQELLASGLFESRLLHAGYFDLGASKYTSRFMVGARLIYSVNEAFPRLTRGNVAIEIRKARYEIDLDLVKEEPVELRDALKQLGVIPQ